MTDESIWIEKAQSAEARLATMQHAYAPALERIRLFKKNFGIKERDNGEIDIDFDKFVENLGEANARMLKEIIDKRYG